MTSANNGESILLVYCCFWIVIGCGLCLHSWFLSRRISRLKKQLSARPTYPPPGKGTRGNFIRFSSNEVNL
jgi:hypothetical protein